MERISHVSQSTKMNQSPITLQSVIHLFPFFSHQLTKADVVFATPLTVHLVDEETGNRFEHQAQDGHACTKTEQVRIDCSRHIAKTKMNNISQDGHCQPDQELNEEEQRSNISMTNIIYTNTRK